jgi:hypothetical protein
MLAFEYLNNLVALESFILIMIFADSERDRARSIYINCPFDGNYAPVLDAVVLSILGCGYLPRIAFEDGSSDELRINRIVKALISSRYSFHDLVRCQGEGLSNLGRFNMPLELGIAIGIKSILAKDDIKHEWFAVVPSHHDHSEYASNLKGYDLKKCDGSEQDLIYKIMCWLHAKPNRPLPQLSDIDPAVIIRALPRYRQEKIDVNTKYGGEPVPWSIILRIAVHAIQSTM